MADAGMQSCDAPIAVFIQIVSRQLQTLRGPPSPDPRRGAEPVRSDLVIVAPIGLGQGDAGARWDGTGWDGLDGFAPGQPGTLCPSFPLAGKEKCGCMDAAAPLEHPGPSAGGHRSWPGSVPFPGVHPRPAVLFISPSVRMLWVTLQMGSCRSSSSSRSGVRPEEGAAVLHGDASPASPSPGAHPGPPGSWGGGCQPYLLSH